MLIAAASLTMIVFAAALAIDIGGRADTRRNDQKVSDMAALDTVQYLSSGSLTTEAQHSLDRNGFTSSSDQLVDVVPGQWLNDSFSPNAMPYDAVKVDVASTYNDFFGGGSATLSGSSIADLENVARFQIGSTLLTVGTCPSTPPSLTPPPSSANGQCSLLNDALGAMGVSTGIGLVGYQGLATTNVTLSALATALGLSALPPSELLTTQVTAAQLAQAAATFFTAGGTSNAQLSALYTELLASSVDSNNSFSLGSVLGITQGNGVGLGTSVNLLTLLSGGVELANNSAGIFIPLTTANLGPFGSVAVSLTGIVPAGASPGGPPGTSNSATDTQVTLNMTATTSLPLVGLNLYSVTLPITLTVGGASAYVASVNGCTTGVTTPTSVTLTGMFSTASGPTFFKDLAVDITGGKITLAGANVGTINGSVTEDSNATSPSPSIADPLNFITPGGNTSYTVSSNPASPSPDLVIGGVAGLTTPIVNALFTGPTSLIAELTTYLDPVLSSALSVHIGSADLLGLQTTECGEPELVK